jgi:hypothetical protein
MLERASLVSTMRARRLDADCAVVVHLERPLPERVTRRGRGVSPASATIVCGALADQRQADQRPSGVERRTTDVADQQQLDFLKSRLWPMLTRRATRRIPGSENASGRAARQLADDGRTSKTASEAARVPAGRGDVSGGGFGD